MNVRYRTSITLLAPHKPITLHVFPSVDKPTDADLETRILKFGGFMKFGAALEGVFDVVITEIDSTVEDRRKAFLQQAATGPTFRWQVL